MYNALADYLKRPSLFERTKEKFWNDPHIAAQMLKAHLDIETDAASRRPDFIDKCAKWVSSLLPNGAHILDIGCGPGLYTKRFAEQGLRVTGLDFSESSIAYARKHDTESEYVVQDYLAMDYENEFDIITLIYYDYGALIPAERRELLCRVYRALKPGGLFLLDAFTPRRGDCKHDCTSWQCNPDGGFFSARPHICINAEYYYGEHAQGRRHVIVEDDGVRCFNIWDCYFTRESLLEEAAPFGFSEEGFFGDAAGRPYEDDAQTFCAVLKKGEGQ